MNYHNNRQGGGGGCERCWTVVMYFAKQVRLPIGIFYALSLNIPVRSAVAVAVVQVRVRPGQGRGLAGRVVRAARYDAEIAGAQHGALLVGRRGRQVRRQFGRIVGLLVQPGRTRVAELAEQRPERRQELLAIAGRVPSVLRKHVNMLRYYCTHTRTSRNGFKRFKRVLCTHGLVYRIIRER